MGDALAGRDGWALRGRGGRETVVLGPRFAEARAAPRAPRAVFVHKSERCVAAQAVALQQLQVLRMHSS